ncbi:oligoendopeptidase F [Chitinophaga terrae (ex Kim and Jung 2007)]|uniref:Oligoendopeptidase F n=1 Tax=Chitinophaga terrae (ex Kim and Jung 2007) TaxID=408074 RepID=A0A1H4DVY2_9BACT|nr:M3 family oligoendopeptidase [Chitinophaga terrae (ex Kim and Jung 2007)]MDQ0104992.1 oligoendopeptidase F [Chitinophaga terrae (ex Kim and Jung 2007)]GEP91320.1 oligoendopeptidase F [Chitinophaga terrae (ex Kim and Jung 2007)]SEA76901.1 oligoendopeptidase F [Chitinophaga terrae (ex Kim and Jung 2007)]
MNNLSADIKKLPRHFLPEDFKVTTWETLQPYFEALQQRNINSVQELEAWLKDISELEAVISEDACWRQIKMTCDTTDKSLEEAFAYFCMEIQPKLQPYADALNKKLVESPFVKELDQDLYKTYLRSVNKQIKLFREENIPIQAELSVMAQQYGAIAGKMTITVNGQEYTLQQAAKFLENSDRALREEVFTKTAARRLADKQALDELYTSLVLKRDQVAKNAGFANYRDYKFEELGRFDYTKEDVFQFHEAIKSHIVPLVAETLEKQKAKLKLDVLKPWDTDAEPVGTQPLEPFQTGDELVNKAIETFDQLDPFFGDCLRVMKKMGRLDLESRKGKAPGGYNCPLAETGVPFIFMNAAGQMKDLTTMVHEGGHAVHSFLSHPLALSAFKEYPMEIAEVASMSMELLTMDHWDIFFKDAEQLRRAKLQQLERSITIFPWIATIDKFQHWVYEHPQHTTEERTAKWLEILNEFSPSIVDWTGHEDYRAITWQRQLHLFEVPFYYIEYGIAQLGAIAMWKQYKENKKQALENYVKALSLGSTKTLPELYKAAGIKFDFSPAYVKELADFVKSEISKL